MMPNVANANPIFSFSFLHALTDWDRESVPMWPSNMYHLCKDDNVSVAGIQNLSPELVASAHWLATCRDAFLFEDCVEDSPLRHELPHEKIQGEDGWLHIPDRPGLGVTLNEDFIKKYLVTESA